MFERLILKMKAGFSPSVVYSRMKIGALDYVLEITERNILRMREKSIFFRICWEELLGCYDTVKPYMDYTPEPVRGGCEDDPITLDSEMENELVKVKCEEEESGSGSTLDYKSINVKLENVEEQIAQMKEAIKELQNAKPASARLVYLSGPATKEEVRSLCDWQGDLLAICPKTSYGGRKYFILAVKGEDVDQTVSLINGMKHNGGIVSCKYAQDRGLDIEQIIRNHGGNLKF